jgi:hypothetical protein
MGMTALALGEAIKKARKLRYYGADATRQPYWGVPQTKVA